MGRARDMMARHDEAVKQKLYGRQDSGTCPAIAPVDCQRQDSCCPLSSECVPMPDGGTGCVVSNNQGQTLTLTPRPKETLSSTSAPTTSDTPSATPSTLTTVPVTETTSTSPVPVPTTTESTSTPTPIPVTDTSTFITSLPTTSSTTPQPTETSITSVPVGTTSSTDSTTPSTTLSSVSISSSSTFTPGAIGSGATSPSSPSSNAKGANLNRGQTIALIAAPISAILLAIMAYFIWRRRKANRQIPEAGALPTSPRRGYTDDDERPMTAIGLNRRMGSTRSTGSRASVATTDILLRGSEDGSGPLRSHPVIIPAVMYGANPQSPRTRESSEESSFKSAAATHDSEPSSGSSPILAPFGQEYMHGHVRYSSSPMRYVTKLDGPPSARSGEAAMEGSQPSPSTPQTRHMSLIMNPFGRSSSAAPDSSRVAPPSDWISPTRRDRDERVVSMPTGDGGHWEVFQMDKKGSL